MPGKLKDGDSAGQEGTPNRHYTRTRKTPAGLIAVAMRVIGLGTLSGWVVYPLLCLGEYGNALKEALSILDPITMVYPCE